MSAARMKHFGWGREGEGMSAEERAFVFDRYFEKFRRDAFATVAVPPLDELTLPTPRVTPPASLAAFCTTERHDRAAHSYGKSYLDYVRAMLGQYDCAPDVVAYPRNEAEISAAMDWAGSVGASVAPFGGGSSVCGGVEHRRDDRHKGAVTIDLRNLGKVLEVDPISRAARIEGGAFGPALEAQLKPHNLTLRHFPQSFEYSTLGGWIATRSGGHFASLYTHIDDFVESVRVLTPTGIVESRRLPGSGAGPSPDRMFIGSEGILGIITEAWMRLQDRPKFRAGASVPFADFLDAAEAVRAISQAGIYPANCRVLDEGEAFNSGAGNGDEAVLVLAFESADHPLEPWIKRALECCADHGGKIPADAAKTRTDAEATHEGSAGAWRNAFLNAPYLMDTVAAMGMVSDTFETSITWERFPEFHRNMMETARDVIARVCGKGSVTCRFTHVYPDGPAPYYTILAPGKRGSEMEQWDEIKAAVSDRLIQLGGTITHHHAVGRYHRPWYDRQRPDGFALALKAAKRALDPRAILNPGVLIDPD